MSPYVQDVTDELKAAGINAQVLNLGNGRISISHTSTGNREAMLNNNTPGTRYAVRMVTRILLDNGYFVAMPEYYPKHRAGDCWELRTIILAQR